jgi:tRNA1Val (adenine37-N6)-methyltransferase
VIATTQGHLLNGRVRYTQPATGFRSGIEPVLLGASIPAKTGQRVLEGGTGAGAVLLCLLTRVPGLTGCGIELDPEQAELARANATANGLDELHVLTGDLETVVLHGVFDHAFANPPYHWAGGTASPDAARARAKQASADLPIFWAAALVRPLRPGGTLTFILPATGLPACIAAMAASGCPAEAILPLWPRAGTPAKLAIVSGIKGGRGPMRLLPGLVLHEADGRYTPAADAMLRGAEPLNY